MFFICFTAKSIISGSSEDSKIIALWLANHKVFLILQSISNKKVKEKIEKVKIKDKIYLTDLTRRTIEYEIYNIFVTIDTLLLLRLALSAVINYLI